MFDTPALVQPHFPWLLIGLRWVLEVEDICTVLAVHMGAKWGGKRRILVVNSKLVAFWEQKLNSDEAACLCIKGQSLLPSQLSKSLFPVTGKGHEMASNLSQKQNNRLCSVCWSLGCLREIASTGTDGEEVYGGAYECYRLLLEEREGN